jgi:hypothetical protein|tara:strand:- start:1433 stop:1696 length:264 start_codon:yes stop_codon:yes gene_type:complete
MVVIFLDELKTEQDVLDRLPELENLVIEATCAQRGKRQKIAMAEVQVNMVQKKCAANRWIKCQQEIDRMFNALEMARAETSVNLWQL